MVDVGAFVAQPENVGDRVLARPRWGATSETHPLPRLARVVALELNRAADELFDIAGAAGVHPNDRIADGVPVVTDGDGAGPLTRNTHRRDFSVGLGGEGALRRGDDGGPPGVRVLLGAAAGEEQQLDGFEVAAGEGAVVSDQGNLRARSAEVDSEDELGFVHTRENSRSGLVTLSGEGGGAGERLGEEPDFDPRRLLVTWSAARHHYRRAGPLTSSVIPPR